MLKAIWWAVVAVSIALCRVQVHATDVAARDVALAAVIDAEIQATREYIKLLDAKAAVLGRMIEIEQADVNASALSASTSAAWHRPVAAKPTTERFDDTVVPQYTWFSETTSPRSLHVELLSFRPHGTPGGKKHNHANRANGLDPSVPIVHFLLVLNKHTGALELFHPTTKALLWQQHLDIPAPVTRVFFSSDRASYLVLATLTNELLVFKMRVFHGRRLVAGDHRRLSGKETMTCNSRTTDDKLRACSRPDLFQSSPTQRTAAPFGYHTHFEIEFEMAVSAPHTISHITMVPSPHSLALVTSTADTHLSAFDAHNGSLLGDFESHFGPVSHFQPLSSGIMALAVENQIHFVDVVERRVLGLTCEGSRHMITSLERDVCRHTVLYAGTSDGKGLAFRINRFGAIKRKNPLSVTDLSDDGDLGFPTCTLTAQLQPRGRKLSALGREMLPSQAIVTAMLGHVLLTTGDGHVVLFDTATRPGVPVYLSEKSIVSSLHNGSEIVSVHAGKDPHTHTAAVAIVIDELSRVRVELLAARLTSVSSALDIGWLRAPMMLFCAFGVMFWQQNRFRRAPTSFSDFDLPGGVRHHRQNGKNVRNGSVDQELHNNKNATSSKGTPATMDLLGGELGAGINMFVGGLVIVHVLVLLYWVAQFIQSDNRKNAAKKRQ